MRLTDNVTHLQACWIVRGGGQISGGGWGEEDEEVEGALFIGGFGTGSVAAAAAVVR